MALVTLSSDFGISGPYVGAMKGVILSRLPGATLIDLDHSIRSQSVFEGSFIFELAYGLFPAGTVHLVVIDPGVGTDRKRLAIASGDYIFVGPDNGCLSAALSDAARGYRKMGEDYEAREVAVPSGVTVVSIEDESLLRQPVSSTFEGRDVFAPVAAELAAGRSLTDLGPRLETMLAFPAIKAPGEGRSVHGQVVLVDRFGDLITDIHAMSLPPEPRFLAGGRTMSLSRTYAEAPGLAAIVGSGGTVEIALPRGNAADVLGIGVGDRVIVS